MSKIVTMEEIRKEALDKFDILLLSTEKVPVVQNMLWRDNKTGIEFFRSWNNLRKGQTNPINKSEKLKIENVRKEALDTYGLELLTSEYINSTTKMEWYDTNTGKTFWRRWSSIKEGHLSPINVNDYAKDKALIESYKGLGYRYNQTKEQYLSAIGDKGYRVLIIDHPLLSEPWVTNMANFKRGASTYIKQTGTSDGELIIKSILRNNNIPFKYQYQVEIKGNVHRFDFYLPDNNLFIEYDGKQHFVAIPHWGGEEGLHERKIRDEDKDDFAVKSKEKILRIPYTLVSSDDIRRALSEEIGTPLSEGEITFQHTLPEEVADFYETHSSAETSDEFGINRRTINVYYTKVKGHPKNIKKYREENNIKTKPLRTMEDIKVLAYDRYGIILLSEGKYTGQHQVLSWKEEKSGVVFEKSWINLTKAPNPPRRHDGYEQVKAFIESYKELGYLYEQTEEQYLNAEVLQGNRKFIITHPNMAEPWVTTLSAFKASAETKLSNPKHSVKHLQQEIVEFYTNHTLKETRDKFHIDGSTANRYYTRVKGHPKNPKHAKQSTTV